MLYPGYASTDLMLNGKCLDWYGVCLSGKEIGEARPVVSYASVPGKSGHTDLTLEDGSGNAYMETRLVRFLFTAVGDSFEIMESKLRIGTLNGRIVEAWCTGFPGAFRGRMSVGEWNDSGRISTVTVSIDSDPHLKGVDHELVLAAGTNVFSVEGNRPTFPRFEIVPAVGTKTVKVEYAGKFVQVNSVFGLLKLSVDSGEESCRIGSSLTMPTLDSDYFAIAPGNIVIKMTGGAGKINYEARWNI